MNWIKGVDYPNHLTEEGLKTLSKQHLLEGETPAQMYKRVVNQSSKILKSYNKLSDKFIADYSKRVHNSLWNGWLALSTPVAANTGTNRGLNISCYISRPDDSVDNIYTKVHETSLLTKGGGGVGITFDRVRGRGEPISVGGFTEGVVPFIKVFDSTVLATSQGGVRRGAFSINLPVRHKDIHEFIKMREPKGDVNRQCLNLHHCVTIDDYFMNSVIEGNQEARALWAEIISTRMRTGEPFIMYYHNVHNTRPQDMVKRDLKIDGTNICTEIVLPHDAEHTVVCCLSSVNMAKYDEWKDDPNFLEDCYLFLDTIIEDFINNAKGKIGFEQAVRFSEKSRSLGLGK